MEWDEYGAAGSSSEYTIAQVIPHARRFPVNATSADFIFHRSFDAARARAPPFLRSSRRRAGGGAERVGALAKLFLLLGPAEVS